MAFGLLAFLGVNKRYIMKTDPKVVTIPINSVSSTLPKSYHLPLTVNIYVYVYCLRNEGVT